MSSRILKSGIQITAANGVPSLYDLRYDPENGNVEILASGGVNQTPGTPSGPIFKNGDWTKLADTQIPSVTDRNKIFAEVQSFVRAAYNTNGGATNASRRGKVGRSGSEPGKKNVLPAWASASEQQQITSASPAGGAFNFSPQSFFNLAKLDPDKLKDFLQFGEIDKYIRINEQYPRDALYGRKKGKNPNGQDYIQITQYKYQPPRREDLFNRTASEILSTGSIRGSSFDPKEKPIGSVKLPMPNDINDSNNVNWGEDAMNNLSAAITSAVLQNPGKVGMPAIAGSVVGGLAGIPGLGSAGMLYGLLNAAGIDLNNLPQNAQAIIAPTVASRILAMGQIQVSPESILARGFGVAPNSNLELLFQSPTLREFNFNWKMSPRSEEEAETIRKIIRFFKQGMAAKKLNGAAGAASFFLGTPNVFKVEYKTFNNSLIAGLNRIKTCALTGTSVNYTPEGEWAAYGDGQPVSVIMSLKFQELEPVYDTDYSEAIPSSGEYTNPIKPDEVGY